MKITKRQLRRIIREQALDRDEILDRQRHGFGQSQRTKDHVYQAFQGLVDELIVQQQVPRELVLDILRQVAEDEAQLQADIP